MTNRDTTLAWKYHELTKHSAASIRRSRHYLDWSNQPSQFKIYPELEPIPLPTEFDWTGATALDAISSTIYETSSPSKPTLKQLASILLYSAGVIKEKSYTGGSFYFRAAACAGALYPTEVYVVCDQIEELQAGVYHFNPGDFSLRLLRKGSHGSALRDATGSEPHVLRAPVTLIYTAISWRSSWKYRDRAYRYHFWDSGMIVANALAMAASHRLPACVVTGFVESDIDRILGIDGETELALCMLTLGRDDVAAGGSSAAQLTELRANVIPLSESTVDYPEIRAMHAASSLAGSAEVSAWRSEAAGDGSDPAATAHSVTWIKTQRPADQDLPKISIEEVIERRGSTRRFAKKPILLSDLFVILDSSCRGIPADFVQGGSQITELYMIVNQVTGLEPGAYVYHRHASALELLQAGNFAHKASYLTLEQALGGDASVTLFLMADLGSALARFGNRGYRVAQLEAGIIGGKIYVASYSLRRGATGLTFYDDDVTEFFSPHAAGKSCMLVLSVGVPRKRLGAES
jgi:SagB-type dehydrogenase family enzyme